MLGTDTLGVYQKGNRIRESNIDREKFLNISYLCQTRRGIVQRYTNSVKKTPWSELVSQLALCIINLAGTSLVEILGSCLFLYMAYILSVFMFLYKCFLFTTDRTVLLALGMESLSDNLPIRLTM